LKRRRQSSPVKEELPMTFILPKCPGLFEVRFEGFDHFFDSGLFSLAFL